MCVNRQMQFTLLRASVCNIGSERTHGAWVHGTDSLVSMMIKARKRVETWGCRRRHTLWLNVNHKWVNGILYNTQDEGKKKKQNRMKDAKHQTYCTVIWKKGWVAHSSVIRPFTLVLVELKTTIATLAQTFFICLLSLWWGMKGESPDQVLLKSPSSSILLPLPLVM